jgi:hypothetical protein
MAEEGNGKPVEYKLDASQNTILEIKRLMQEAKTKGIGSAFRNALRRVMHRLRADPSGFGELVQELSHMQVVVHVGSVYPVTVRFGYHAEQRVVYVLKVFLASS